MTVDIEQIKKKIIYRSNYRGTKEMDKLLGAFTNKYLDQLDYQDLDELIKLLEIDDNNLYNFYNGLKTTRNTTTMSIIVGTSLIILKYLDGLILLSIANSLRCFPSEKW